MIPYMLRTITGEDVLEQDWLVSGNTEAKERVLLQLSPTEITGTSQTAIYNNTASHKPRQPRHFVCWLSDIPEYKEWVKTHRAFMTVLGDEPGVDGKLQETANADAELIAGIDRALLAKETEV